MIVVHLLQFPSLPAQKPERHLSDDKTHICTALQATGVRRFVLLPFEFLPINGLTMKPGGVESVSERWPAAVVTFYVPDNN